MGTIMARALYQALGMSPRGAEPNGPSTSADDSFF
jgi:hypothetical protein